MRLFDYSISATDMDGIPNQNMSVFDLWDRFCSLAVYWTAATIHLHAMFSPEGSRKCKKNHHFQKVVNYPCNCYGIRPKVKIRDKSLSATFLVIFLLIFFSRSLLHEGRNKCVPERASGKKFFLEHKRVKQPSVL